jgi:hypothetical protein
MRTRSQRIAEFTTNDEPPSGCEVELLCEDHVGTYLLPFPCRRDNGAWFNTRTGEELQAAILGWRLWGWARAFS